MKTYLRLDELLQEGRELRWTATAFEDRDAPPETRELFDAWVAQVRQVVEGRAEPASGWPQAPQTGRDLARAAGEVLAVLARLQA